MAEDIVPAGRVCSRCGEWKFYSEFHNKAGGKDGKEPRCKVCKSAQKKQEYAKNRSHVLARLAEYRKRNPEKVSEAKKLSRLKKIDQYKQKAREKYINNRDSILAYYKEYREKNRDLVLERSRRYKKLNAAELSRKQVERQRNDPMARLRNDIRSRVNIAIRKKGYTKSSRTAEFLGCGWVELKAHIERQFTKGMSWENRSEWHIDHIVPLASAKTEEELFALCHHTNLRPMWARDNLSKGTTVEYLL